MVFGGVISIIASVLFIFYGTTATNVTFDMAVAMVGIVSIIIPIVDMISVSLPTDSVATGLGLNTMMRNIGGAIGPVVATTIMSTYAVTLNVGPRQLVFPSSTAFDYIFYLTIVTMVIAILLSAAAKNYFFARQPQSSTRPTMEPKVNE